MAATDLLVEVGDPGSATTLSSPGYTSGSSTSINVASTSNWPSTGKAVVFAIDEAEVVDGEEVQVAGTYNEYEGTVASATSVSNVAWQRGSGDRNYSAGSLTRVYIPVSAERENRLVEWGSAEHSEADGTHSDITADSVTLNASGNIDVPSGASIRDGNDNELVTFSQTASAVNEITVKNAATGSGPEIQATGSDTNINIELVPKGTGAITNGTQKIDWWQELGRTTLGSAGDTISVTSLPARKYLLVKVLLLDTGGTVGPGFQFNGDTGSNYARRASADGGAEATQTSQTSSNVGFNSASLSFTEVEIINVATSAKFITGHAAYGNNAASTAPARIEFAGKWANTSDQITRIDVVNLGTGDFAIGSEVVVLGHD